jgi:hypothetical protein
MGDCPGFPMGSHKNRRDHIAGRGKYYFSDFRIFVRFLLGFSAALCRYM